MHPPQDDMTGQTCILARPVNVNMRQETSHFSVFLSLLPVPHAHEAKKKGEATSMGHQYLPCGGKGEEGKEPRSLEPEISTYPNP